MTATKPNSLRNRRGAMRKIPRGSVRVECRHGSSGLGKNIVAQFLDLSEGGARLVVTEALALQNEVEVSVSDLSFRKGCFSRRLRKTPGHSCRGRLPAIESPS